MNLLVSGVGARHLGLLFTAVFVAGLLAFGCSGSVDDTPLAPISTPGQPTAAPDDRVAQERQPSASPTATAAPETGQPDEDDESCFLERSVWKTNLCKHSVPLEEIMAGGPPRDGITPIDTPRFVAVDASPEYMQDDDPVLALEIDGDVRAYPLAILTQHEIVNDEVGGVPVTVTYCPLCNSAIVFDRRVDGRVLDFGTSGMVRHSDLVMWDRQTESWWQQITGEAIVGELTGSQLEFIPAPVVSWDEFTRAYPGGMLLTRDLGLGRNYARPPYVGYDERDSPGLSNLVPDSRLPIKERVVALSVGDRHFAYPFSLLSERLVVNDTIEGKDLVIFFSESTFSPFAPGLNVDLTHQASRPVGSTGVYEPTVDGRRLTFKVGLERFLDEETGSEWNILGQATAGPLKGTQLTPVLHGNHFWFAWVAFRPDTEVRAGDAG